MNLNLHFKNTLWLYLSSFLVLPINYLIRILYADNLSVADYGIFYGMFGFFAAVAFLRDWGINDASTYFANKFLVSKEHHKLKTLFFFNHSVQLVLSFVIVGLFFLFDGFIFKTFYSGEPHISAIFYIFAIYWITETVMLTNRRFLDIFQDQKANSFFHVISLGLILGLSFVAFSNGSLLTYQVPPVAYTISFGFIAFSSLLYILIKYQKILLSPSFCLELGFFKKIFKFSSALVIAGLTTSICSTTDIIIIQYFKGSEEVAFYSTAVSTAILITMLAIPISRVITPLVAKFWHSKNPDSITNILSFLFNNFGAFIFPLAGIMFVFAESFILIIYGEAFLPTVILLKFLCVGIIIYTINNILYPLISAIGKPKEISLIIVITGLINIIGNLMVINLWGSLGVVWVTIFSYFVSFVLCLRLFKNQFKIIFDPLHLLKIVFSSGIFVVVAFFLLKNIYFEYFQIGIVDFVMNVGIIFVISSIFYIATLFITGAVSKKKLTHLKNILVS